MKYSFCVGGKDGVPFPVNRTDYDETTAILKNALEQAKLGSNERIDAIKRLKTFSQENEAT